MWPEPEPALAKAKVFLTRKHAHDYKEALLVAGGGFFYLEGFLLQLSSRSHEVL